MSLMPLKNDPSASHLPPSAAVARDGSIALKLSDDVVRNAGPPEAAGWPAAATAASVPPSSALTDTAMTRMNRVLRDKGERLMAGSRMIFLKAPAGFSGFGQAEIPPLGSTATQRCFPEHVP